MSWCSIEQPHPRKGQMHRRIYVKGKYMNKTIVSMNTSGNRLDIQKKFGNVGCNLLQYYIALRTGTAPSRHTERWNPPHCAGNSNKAHENYKHKIITIIKCIGHIQLNSLTDCHAIIIDVFMSVFMNSYNEVNWDRTVFCFINQGQYKWTCGMLFVELE